MPYCYQTALKEKLVGGVEIDESYFVAKRQRGYHGKRKRGQGTTKQPVFGVFEREGKVYTEIVPDCKRLTLQAVILGKVSIESIIYSTMVGEVTMVWWIQDIPSIFVFLMVTMSLRVMDTATLMVLNHSGVLPSGG